MAQASAPGWITLTLGLLALLATLAFFDDTSLLPQASASEDAWPDRMLVDERARSTYAAQARLEILTVGWVEGTRAPPLAQLARLHELTLALTPNPQPQPQP